MNANATLTEVSETKRTLHESVMAVIKEILSALIMNKGNGEHEMLG